MIKKIKTDNYLEEFVNICRQVYGDNLIAIGIYGSYAWGYFDKEKSDYDVFLIFSNLPEEKGENLLARFNKVSIQYFCDTERLFNLIKEGHWSLYITLLKSAKMLYYSENYKTLIKKLKKFNFIQNLKDTKRIEWKLNFNIEAIEKSEGFERLKYTLPALRSQLQLLTYVQHNKLIWNLKKIIRINRKFLTLEERNFLIQMDKSVRERKDIPLEKDKAINLLKKIHNQVISLIKPIS